jgi:transcriptional regulator with GAF, ATPase, and Fis domain
MTSKAQNILDLTRDLGVAAQMGASPDQIDSLLGEAVETLGRLVPYDLATIMQLRGEELKVRIARGTLMNKRLQEHRLRLQDFPGIREIMKSNRARAFTERDHREGDGDVFDGVLDLPHGHSCMVVPLRDHSGPLGIMTFDRKSCGVYPHEVVDLAEVIGRLLAMAMSYGEQSWLLERLKEQLEEQNRLLSERVEGRTDACRMMEASRSPATVRVVRQARQVAVTDTPVLITGETGTGKEVLANAIHGWSNRSDRPLVGINCAALPPGLIESELFGHVKGAFSGATGSRMGRFQAANGGTLFLDEIGELSIELQAKLLRVVQEGCFEPVGSDRTVRVDVRIIAATNVDLLAAVADHRFREDLYYRLAVFPVHLPPLRERPEDIRPIAEHFLASLSRRTGRPPWHLTQQAARWLEQQRWRGNVRELVNTLERATILSPGRDLRLGPENMATGITLPTLDSSPQSGAIATLEEMERRHIERALAAAHGRLYGSGGAADMLDMNPNTLRSRMKKLGLGGVRDLKRKG